MQAGVGGVAAAVAGHLAIVLGDKRPTFVVVDPARAACIFETAKAGHPVKIAHGEPTVMAMLECYEPSPLAWRVLSRAADAFMTVEDADAVAVMNRLARPAGGDPRIVAGESGGAGLAGAIRAATDPEMRAKLGLTAASRIFVINTEGATDPAALCGACGNEAGRGHGVMAATACLRSDSPRPSPTNLPVACLDLPLQPLRELLLAPSPAGSDRAPRARSCPDSAGICAAASRARS